MLSQSMRVLVVMGLMTSRAQAFDPVSVMAGVQAGSAVMEGLGLFNDVSEFGFAATDLLQEFDVDLEAHHELSKAIRDLEELQSKVKEAKSLTLNSKDQIDSNLKRYITLSERLQRFKKLVQLSKRIAVFVSSRPKSSSKPLEIQQVKIQSMILDELMAMRRESLTSQMQSKEERIRFDVALENVLKEEERARKAWQVRR